MAIEEAEREVHIIETGMKLLADDEATYWEWRRIVVRYKILGVQVHDGRLAAAMHVHGITHILTLNRADFSRFPELTVIHPNDL